MADSTAVAVEVTPLPSPADIARAEQFAHEQFVHEGEDAAVALAPGSARRRALDRALTEIDEGLSGPSTKWRRRFSLLLGLERVLSEDEPHLVDGTLLNPHQVDALSGTLTALLAELAQRAGTTIAPAAEPVLDPTTLEPAAAEEDADSDDEQDPDTEIELEDLGEQEPVDDGDEDEEPQDWADAPTGEDDDEEITGEVPDDPNAHKRFWFEHATGAGKTVAALGFVEASRTGGTLILTHRRNLVDQFNGELKDRG